MSTNGQRMNYTHAACGHLTLAIGAPGSPARVECERQQCPACRQKRDANRSRHQQQVARFMSRAGQDVPDKPVMPDAETRLLRAMLIFEEAMETIAALGCELQVFSEKAWVIARNEARHPPDMVGIVDGCADLSVVTVGTLVACGVPDLPVLAEVDAANLRKFEGDAHCDPTTGKWIKPTGFKPPDIARVLKIQGWNE